MYVASLVFAAVVGQSNPSDASRANLDRIFKEFKASVVVVTDNRTSQWRYMPGPIEKVLGPVLYGENQKITPFTAGILVQPNPTLPVEVASRALIAGLRGLTSDQRKKLNRGGIFAGDLSESTRFAAADLFAKRPEIAAGLRSGESVLSAIPVIEVTDLSDPRKTFYFNGDHERLSEDESARMEQDKTFEFKLPMPSTDGALYEKGKLLTLADWLAELQQKLRKSFIVDPKLLRLEVFVMGRFNSKQVTEILDELSKVEPSRTINYDQDEPVDLAIDISKYPGVSPVELAGLKGKEFSGAELAQRFPWAKVNSLSGGRYSAKVSLQLKACSSSSVNSRTVVEGVEQVGTFLTVTSVRVKF